MCHNALQRHACTPTSTTPPPPTHTHTHTHTFSPWQFHSWWVNRQPCYQLPGQLCSSLLETWFCHQQEFTTFIRGANMAKIGRQCKIWCWGQHTKALVHHQMVLWIQESSLLIQNIGSPNDHREGISVMSQVWVTESQMFCMICQQQDILRHLQNPLMLADASLTNQLSFCGRGTH